MKDVKHIIAVASGKGGVGKSTTSVNLALALAKQGAKVGMVDADVYGPSLPMMLGVSDGTRPEVFEQKFFVPVEAQGIKSMSMGYLATEQTPMVWRGPMASGALLQILTQTLWGDLDYLVVDMPPGTGDIQLTLAQKAQLSGAVIVTTPQDIALLDARKAIEMFRKVNIPILGIVENMAVHSCSQCGHQEHIFGEGGGERVAAEYGTEVLGALPLSLDIREQSDSGKPTVMSDPNGTAATAYGQIASKVAAILADKASPGGPEIVIE
jgi:ATP-binding protein involved in chromosome partitioning